jgi:phosphopantetheine adenylyltransferase
MSISSAGARALKEAKELFEQIATLHVQVAAAIKSMDLHAEYLNKQIDRYERQNQEFERRLSDQSADFERRLTSLEARFTATVESAVFEAIKSAVKEKPDAARAIATSLKLGDGSSPRLIEGCAPMKSGDGSGTNS